MDKDEKILMIAAALLVGGVGGLWLRHSQTSPAPSAPTAVVQSPPTAPPAPAPLAPVLPSLDDSDTLARSKAGKLSTDARWEDWIKPEGLLRRGAAVFETLSAGSVPREALSFLSPRKKFLFKRRSSGVLLDPNGYSRYDKTADIFSSIDAPAAGAFLKEMKPLFEQACREFGGRTCAYPDAFTRAATPLIETPVVEGEVKLKDSEKGIVYLFADERLERLKPAQKQLLRMGPRNQKLIQAKLKDILKAL